MTATIYRSSDASAPVLSGTAGTLVNILDACLVNGYGAKAAAGWAKAFSSTNIAAYRAAAGSRMYLRVDDTSAQEARISGYEAMSGASAGTGQYPNGAQLPGGLFVRKSETSDATTRPWVVVATGTCFYFLVQSNSSDWTVSTSTPYLSGQFFFGDLISYKPGDQYHSLIIGATSTGIDRGNLGGINKSSSFSANSGHYMPRNHLQIGGPIAVSKVIISDFSTASTVIGAASSYPVFPDSVSGGMLLSPLVIVEGSDGGSRFAVRGLLPGLWAPLHNMPMNHADVLDGSGDMAGKQFLMFNISTSSSLGRAALEISNTW